MCKKPTSLENFLYLLSEMEDAVDRDDIRGTARRIENIQDQLVRIAQKMGQASQRRTRGSSKS